MKNKIFIIAIFFLSIFAISDAMEFPLATFEANFSETFYKNDIEMVSVVVCVQEGHAEEVRTFLSGKDNVRISFGINNFIGADIPLAEWKDILEHPLVDYVVGSVRVEEQLDVSAGGAGSDDLYVVDSYIANNQGITGQNVLIGMIDSGLDVEHLDFRTSSEDTRVKYYLDQYTGEEYDEDYINSHIDDFPSHDTRGHGTWVTGIAGGDGSSSNGTYTGVAPEAEFVIVKYNGYTNGVLEAIEYCIEKALYLISQQTISC